MKSILRSFLSVAIAAVAVFGAAGCVKAQDFFGNPLIGRKAPSFTLDTVRGEEIALDDAIKGQKAVLVFWATWCPHCRTQVVALNSKKAEMEKQGIVILLVDIGESPRVVQRFMDSKGLDFNVLLDADSAIAEKYQVAGVPTLVFIGADGKVRESLHVFPSEYLDILG